MGIFLDIKMIREDGLSIHLVCTEQVIKRGLLFSESN